MKKTQEMHAKLLHDTIVSIWFRFMLHSLSEIIFYEEENPKGHDTCSVNAQCYHEMLHIHVIPILQQRGFLQATIFMQDGASPHVVIRVQQLCR